MILLMICSGNRHFLYNPAPVERNLGDDTGLGNPVQADGIV